MAPSSSPVARALAFSLLVLTARSATTPESAVQCGNERVCDPFHILSPQARAQLETRLRGIEALPGPKSCGASAGDGFTGTPSYQMGVVLVESLEAHGHAGDIRSFSENVFNRLGIGTRGCDSGVLLALSRSDRLNHLTTGRGARLALTDAHASDILLGLRPALRAGDMDAAVAAAVERVVQEALQPGRPPLWYRINTALIGLPHAACSHPLLAVFATVVAGHLAVLVYSDRRRRAFARRLRALEHARAAYLKLAADAGTDPLPPPCAICLEALPSLLTFEREPTHNGAELLRCGHCFHQECVRRWARSRRLAGLSCPLCRRSNARVDGSAEWLPATSQSLRGTTRPEHQTADDNPGATRPRPEPPSPERPRPVPLNPGGSGHHQVSVVDRWGRTMGVAGRAGASALADVGRGGDVGVCGEGQGVGGTTGDTGVWGCALDSLAEEFADVAGVRRWHGWVSTRGSDGEAWTAAYQRHAMEEALEAEEWKGAASKGESSGGSDAHTWGGGSCDGGGGAGGSW